MEDERGDVTREYGRVRSTGLLLMAAAVPLTAVAVFVDLRSLVSGFPWLYRWLFLAVAIVAGFACLLFHNILASDRPLRRPAEGAPPRTIAAQVASLASILLDDAVLRAAPRLRPAASCSAARCSTTSASSASRSRCGRCSSRGAASSRSGCGCGRTRRSRLIAVGDEGRLHGGRAGATGRGGRTRRVVVDGRRCRTTCGSPGSSCTATRCSSWSPRRCWSRSPTVSAEASAKTPAAGSAVLLRRALGVRGEPRRVVAAEVLRRRLLPGPGVPGEVAGLRERRASAAYAKATFAGLIAAQLPSFAGFLLVFMGLPFAYYLAFVAVSAVEIARGVPDTPPLGTRHAHGARACLRRRCPA